ncbi:hydrogen peroxide-dependent heme synthase [Robertmurraya sp.]|uniref:hydrogen peroxide-dependent heme synthase n=1 Tax=Robertmurraya sp. TaxID=2837525 RepID=UPI003703AD2C
MSNAAETLEGWYCLNDFRKIYWERWKSLGDQQRKEVLEEMKELLNCWTVTQEKSEGSHALFQITGHKADIMFMFLRPTLDELLEIELALNKTKLADYTLQSNSYVSVVELSNFLPEGEDPYNKPEIRERLFPKIPTTDYVCFYPMNKLLSASDNWYMLTSENLKQMMRSHSLIGRKYSGKVKQIILGSVGLDDYEWGVALFGEDPIQFKKLIYEMRFDEVSARFGQFGSFFVGKYMSNDQLVHLLQI